MIAIISNNKKNIIEGIVLEISAEELLVADEYETNDYKRVKEKLGSGKEAWVYVSAKIT